MEITNALLVAMMFIVLLTIGIGNIIMGLATIVDKRTPVKPDAIHTSWVVLLLLIHFNLFWHVLDILQIEEWTFLGFLYIVAGAMLVFFATHILLPDSSSSASEDLRAHYFAISQQFFLFLGLLQIWTIGVDFLLGSGFTNAAVFNVAGAVLFGILAINKKPGQHQIGMWLGWGLFGTIVVARGMGWIN